MSYEYDYYASELGESLLPVFSVLVAVFLAVWVIAMLVGVVLYVIRSLSLHTIAKRRGIHNAWLSWIPVGQEWIIGSLSDQFKYLTQGKNQSRRKLLLGLNLAGVVLSLISGAISVAETVADTMAMAGYSSAVEEAALGVMLPVASTLVIAVVSSVVSVVAYVFRQMSMYDLYKSCNPKNAVVFLVLGILFGITEPFFLLSCRNKDEGMPPRKSGNPAAEPEAAPIVDAEPVEEASVAPAAISAPAEPAEDAAEPAEPADSADSAEPAAPADTE